MNDNKLDSLSSGIDFESGKNAAPVDFSSDAQYDTEEDRTSKWALRDRLRSPALWSSLLSLVIVVLSAFNVWEKIGITSDQFREIAIELGSVIAAFGIFNDPTSRKSF